MVSILIKQFQTTGIYPEFQLINSVEIEDIPFAEGGFGEVYHCVTINGNKPSISQVIKLFKDRNRGSSSHNLTTIQRLQAKLKNLHEDFVNNGKDLFKEYPAFKGIPLFSFEGVLNGQKVIGFSSNNLVSLGFEEFGKILSNKIDEFKDIPIDYKILLSHQLASAFSILDEFKYIHADLKAEAIFINLQKNECAIIDFDSGVITENPNDEPQTWGAPNDWVAPEIWTQQSPNNPIHKIHVDIFSDRWSVTIGVIYFLTGEHPLFFLKELSPNGTDPYFKNNTWPYADTNASYFESKNLDYYKWNLNFLKNEIPVQILNTISTSINSGYKKPHARATYKTWESVFRNAQKPPEIKFFLVDRTSIIKGINCELSWEVENAQSVDIDNGIGRVTTKGSIKIKPITDITYTLKVIGCFGEAFAQVDINVFPTPILQSLMIPTPDFSNHLHYNIQIGTPHIDVSFNMPNFNFNPPQFTNPNVDLNKIKPEYKPKVSIFNLSKIYEHIKQRTGF